ncbi:MAG: MarR family winged helix-turn-helix transcriptional regulator [Halioglobus sp.]
MSSTSLGEAVHRLMHAYKNLLREGIRDQKIDLPVTHIRVLKGVCRSPESTAQSIAQLMQRDKAQITRALNDLIGTGLILKVDNPLDRRSQLLKPTPKGKKVMVKLDSAEDWAVKQLTKDLKANDLAFFLQISNTMADSVEQISTADTGKH